MESAEEVRRMKRFAIEEERRVVPAVITILAAVLGLTTIAAGPWLLLTAGAPWEAPAIQATAVSPAVAESKRIFDERRERAAAARLFGGAQTQAGHVVVSAQEPK